MAYIINNQPNIC